MNQEKIYPPLVSYEIRQVENRAKSIAAGHYMADDVVYVRVQQRGGRDTTERPYADWIELQKQHASENRIPEEWIEKFERAYERFVKGEEIPEEGTSIKNWPVPTPAQVKMLLGLNLLTVEQVAVANTEVIGRMGMGGLTLKQQANDYLDAANASGKLVARLNQAESENKVLAERNATLEARMAALEAKLGVVSEAKTEEAPKQFQL